MLLYALGIGCSRLEHVYENADEFAAFPTFPVSLQHKGSSSDIVDFPSPTLQTPSSVDLSGTRALLDAERYIEFHAAVPCGEGTQELQMQTRLVGTECKRQGTILHSESELRDADGTLLYRLDAAAYAVGAMSATSFGRTVTVRIDPPNREPDATHVERVPAHQALLYRLCGDYNPLHVDPQIAEASGFDRPILHGLCTLGFACRAVLDRCACGDAKRFRAARARFVGTVAPGDVLKTSMWIESRRRVLFRTEVVCDDGGGEKLVVSNAYVDLAVDAELRPAPPTARL